MNWQSFIAYLSAPWWAGVQGITSVIGLVAVVIAVRTWVIEMHRARTPRLVRSVPQTRRDGDGRESQLLRIENTGSVGATVISLAFGHASFVREHGEVIPNVLMPGAHFVMPLTNITPESWVVVGYIPHSDMRSVIFDWFPIMEVPPDPKDAEELRGPTVLRGPRLWRARARLEKAAGFGRDGVQRRTWRIDRRSADKKLQETISELMSKGGEWMLLGSGMPATSSTTDTALAQSAPPQAEPPTPDPPMI